MKKIKGSKQLDALVETFLSGKRGNMRRCCTVSRLIQAADMYTMNEANMYSVVREVADAAFILAQESKGKDVFRISVTNPDVDVYYIGKSVQVTRYLKNLWM